MQLPVIIITEYHSGIIISNQVAELNTTVGVFHNKLSNQIQALRADMGKEVMEVDRRFGQQLAEASHGVTEKLDRVCVVLLAGKPPRCNELHEIFRNITKMECLLT